MADERVDALSIKLQDGETADKLKEEYGKVIENIMAHTVSAKLKNTDLSGDITAGSVNAKRFVNITGKEYGTARKGGEGQKVKVEPVIVPVNDKTEYMEEVEELDIQAYGVDGLIERRTANQQASIEAELEEKFFAVAKESGTAFTPTSTTDVADEIEEAIQTIETTQNDFVRGVPRNMIEVVMTPNYYGKLRNKIAQLPSPQANVQGYESGIFNNVVINSDVFLPDGVDYMVMVKGAVAQPTRLSVYAPKKIELSDATAFGAFLYKGTKAVMPDLIIYKATA